MTDCYGLACQAKDCQRCQGPPGPAPGTDFLPRAAVPNCQGRSSEVNEKNKLRNLHVMHKFARLAEHGVSILITNFILGWSIVVFGRCNVRVLREAPKKGSSMRTNLFKHLHQAKNAEKAPRNKLQIYPLQWKNKRGTYLYFLWNGTMIVKAS